MSQTLVPYPDGIAEVDFDTVDGVFIKYLSFAKAGVYLMQHKHEYAHGHFLARGKAELFVEGVSQGVFSAPHLFHIEAGKFHQIQSKSDDTVSLCIHNTHGAGMVSVMEESQPEGS